MALDCPFCQPTPDRLIEETPLVRVLRDGFPVSPGHTLVVPRRHVGSFFEASEEERAAILHAIVRARRALDAAYAPNGYNIGLNDGSAAGQTVDHCHVHVIPRFEGDVSDPRGGVRWVIPDKARYW